MRKFDLKSIIFVSTVVEITTEIFESIFLETANFETMSSTALDVLNSICEKRSYKSFKTLTHGEYIIRRFSSIESNFGNRIRIDFDDGFSYLPERFNTLSSEHITELNLTPKIMVYAGKDSVNSR